MCRRTTTTNPSAGRPNPAPPPNAPVAVAALCEKYNVELVAIGNGTASRE
ncbi:hypothetical protein FAT61_22075, partial [Klebsiella pneumoniae subsp. pneumoniae]